MVVDSIEKQKSRTRELGKSELGNHRDRKKTSALDRTDGKSKLGKLVTQNSERESLDLIIKRQEIQNPGEDGKRKTRVGGLQIQHVGERRLSGRGGETGPGRKGCGRRENTQEKKKQQMTDTPQ